MCILNIGGTFYGNVNKQIHILQIFPFPMISIRKKITGVQGVHIHALHY